MHTYITVRNLNSKIQQVKSSNFNTNSYFTFEESSRDIVKRAANEKRRSEKTVEVEKAMLDYSLESPATVN